MLVSLDLVLVIARIVYLLLKNNKKVALII